MKFCPSCGKPYTEGMRFCDNCGSPLNATPEKPVAQPKPVIDDEEKTIILTPEKNKEADQAPVVPPAVPVTPPAAPVVPPAAPVVPPAAPVVPPAAPVVPPAAPVVPPAAPVTPPAAPVTPPAAPVTPPAAPVTPPAAPVTSQPPKKEQKKKGAKSKILIGFVLFLVLSIILALAFTSSDSDNDTTPTNSSSGSSQTTPTQNNPDTDKPTENTTPGNTNITNGPGINQISGSTLQSDNLSYVLIYNPNIFDERDERDSSTLSTGDFNSSQVDIDASRGEGLETEAALPFGTLSQSEIDNLTPDFNPEAEISRADTNGPSYSLGDKHTFGHFSSTSSSSYETSEFQCVYEGKYCYIWMIDTSLASIAETYGKAFDEQIYGTCVNMFGKPRFVGETGKVNFLFYNMPSGLGGCFRSAEIFAKSELSDNDLYYVDKYKINTDHAILHINITYAKESKYQNAMMGTLAHEFQHLIYGSNSLTSSTAVWLNEAMSGYIEEKLFPGGKDDSGHFKSFETSSLIRRGQSLYNFATTSYDIGVYGSVYYFSEYLKTVTGSDSVFSAIHSYWNNTSNGNESEALYESFNQSGITKIDEFITYPDSLSFSSTEEKWMSKLALSFYINLLGSETGIPNVNYINIPSLLYDDLNGASIEGGGRIIVAVKDGKFDIPSDSDNGLIYIGLDNNFNVITGYIYK